ncbi:KTSC domain-containing protein [Lysobacter panacisoli]|uniref:KTSC domain-containing protein n=1 Tax=Lysobacter panacisoli TaxID=1255263 RepID=A0ABP9LBM2_9GAMM|nr:KTSC domain-containing protein [Lysobacter panacisoli]
MERRHVDSQALRSIGYDPDRQVLEIEFESGAVYRYFDVPPHLHDGLMAAPSHGEYFSRHIRDAGFDYLQLDTPDPPSHRHRLTRP